MSQRSAGACCAVGAREDAAQIDEALRTGTPYRQVAVERGCPELASAIYRHRAHLKADGSAPSAPAASAAAASAHATVKVKQNAKQPEASGAKETPTLSLSGGRARAVQPPSREPEAPLALPADDAQRATADRIRTIANLIAVAAWKNRTHVQGLAQRWGVSEDEVRRLHARAALSVKADRGTYAAQRELSVALVSKMRDEELASASMYEKAAEEAFLQAAAAPPGKMSSAPAKLAKSLAGMARTTALRCEEYISKITFARPKDPHQILNVTFSADPNYTRAAEIQRVILDTLEATGQTKGISAKLGEVFVLWEQAGGETGGDAALEEWRREQLEAGALLLMQGDDGSFSAGEAVA